MKHQIREPRYRTIQKKAQDRNKSRIGAFQALTLGISVVTAFATAYVYLAQAGVRDTLARLMALQERNFLEQSERTRAERIAEAQSLLNPGRQASGPKTTLESRFDPRVGAAIQFLAENQIKVEISADFVELYDLPVVCAEIEIDADSIIVGNSNFERTRLRSGAKVVLLRDSRLNDFELMASGGLQDVVEAKVTVSDSLILASDIYSPVGVVRIVDSSSRDGHIFSKAGYVRFDRYRGKGVIEFSDLENLPSGCREIANAEHMIAEKSVICRKQTAASAIQPSWPEIEESDCEMFSDGRRSFTDLDRELMRSTVRWNAIMIDEAEFTERSDTHEPDKHDLGE